MFSPSKKTIEITIGDGESDASDFTHEKPSHTFTSPFGKKSHDEPAMFRVKSAQVLSGMPNNGELNAADALGSSTQLNEKNSKKTKQRLFGKLIPHTKSMPLIYKEGEKDNGEETEETRKKQVKMSKSKLSQEGQKKLHDLVSFLHKDIIPVCKHEDSDEDLGVTPGMGHSFAIDKYFEQEEEVDPKNKWKARFVNLNLNKSKANTDSVVKQDDVSANGYRLVRRFGQGIHDGCGFPLSLKKEETGDEWKNLVEDADEALTNLESLSRTSRPRRGSIMQPRLLFVTPHPETGFGKVWQTAHCLPLRKWTSELFIASKEGTTLLDPDVKRHLKWNASVEDFRHLLSSDLQYFSSDIDSMLVKTDKSQVATRTKGNPVTFRRQSCAESLWNTDSLLSKRGDDYKHRLEILRRQNSDGPPDGPSDYERRERLKPVFKPLRFAIGDEHALDCLSAQILASELTAIARELFLSLNPTEVSRLLLKPQLVDEESCPDITALLGFQRRIMHLFATCILEQSTIADRAKRVVQFIEVAEELKHLKNWHSLFSVITSLQSLPVARLKLTWSYLSNNYADHYCEYISLSELLKKDDVDEIDYTGACIPLFDDWIQDLKIRCAIKIEAVRKQSTRGHWTRPETLPSWLYGEIAALETLASQTGKKKATKKSKKNGKDRNIFRRIKRNFSNKHLHEHENVELKQTPQVKEPAVDAEPAPQRSSMNGSSACTKRSDECFLIDIPELKPEEEREILKEISNGLVEYQNKAMMYEIENANEMAQNFLLYHAYNSMDTNMAKSIQLEPSERDTARMETVTRL